MHSDDILPLADDGRAARRQDQPRADRAQLLRRKAHALRIGRRHAQQPRDALKRAAVCAADLLVRQLICARTAQHDLLREHAQLRPRLAAVHLERQRDIPAHDARAARLSLLAPGFDLAVFEHAHHLVERTA